MNTKNQNLVIIDADTIIYLVGYSLAYTQNESLGIDNVNEFIYSILRNTNSDHYLGYFDNSNKKSKNFRYNLAITKPYKGNRKNEKDEWFQFWEPILKKHLQSYWGFIPIQNIEADDPCTIAANHYRDKYTKVIIASPDKDLKQLGDLYFYDIKKQTLVYVSYNESMINFCGQIIKGDSADNIPGLPGAGVKAVSHFLDEYEPTIENVKLFYIKWFSQILTSKSYKNQVTSYLKQYKIENNISKLNSRIKQEALKHFIYDSSNDKTTDEISTYFNEMYQLVYLLRFKEEGEKHGFNHINIQQV